jgi:hypothetical protein
LTEELKRISKLASQIEDDEVEEDPYRSKMTNTGATSHEVGF